VVNGSDPSTNATPYDARREIVALARRSARGKERMRGARRRPFSKVSAALPTRVLQQQEGHVLGRDER